MVQAAGRAARARIAFVSSNFGWGGSEELWAATAAALAQGGHSVSVFKHGLPRRHRRIRRLKSLACRLHELGPAARLAERFPAVAKLRSGKLSMAVSVAILWLRLRLGRRFDLIVISQGGNSDGWPLIAVCRRLGAAYAIVCHKASDVSWPPRWWRAPMRRGFANAKASFFVSKHTLRLTEEQIGERVPRASLVLNPFNVPWNKSPPWPCPEGGVRLGCVGRLHIREKGQDILLRVLSLPKWRSRPVSMTFLGAGDDRESLEDLAALLGLTSVHFAGTCDDMAAFWADHHALVLASRAEGLPLVIVEAQLSGRIAIVSDAGGNAELIEDNVTGFVADAPTEKAVDEALERAWSRRAEWEALGTAAADRMRELVPQDPAQNFARRLLDLSGHE